MADDYTSITMLGVEPLENSQFYAFRFEVHWGDEVYKVRLLRDNNSDVFTYAGNDMWHLVTIGDESYTPYQLVRLALPMAPGETKVLDAGKLEFIQQMCGPLQWAAMLSGQGRPVPFKWQTIERQRAKRYGWV